VASTRRIGKWLLAFKWAALAFTVVVTAIALWKFAWDRSTSQVLSIPPHFLPVPQSTLPNPVSDSTVGLFVVVLGLIVVVQLIVLAVTQMGRHRAAIPILTEVALWIGFCFSYFEMTKGYNAAVACAGPPTHCTVTYPSVTSSLVAGLLIGAVIGATWRIAYKHDQRRLSFTSNTESVPRISPIP